MSDNLPERPIFIGGGPEWRSVADNYPRQILTPVSVEARAISIAVFRAASIWADMFAAPTDIHIHSWAEVFERHLDWLTIDLAERAVNEHMRQASITGHMTPGPVLKHAGILRLELEAQS